ncbi:MAG TPA: serine protease [Devosia sp.]|nr:serine protease [Devosia sp.]
MSITFCAAAGAAELDTFTVGAWDGGSYSNDQDGLFTHCAANARYNSELTLVVVVDRQYDWFIGIQNPDWQLNVGEEFPFDLKIDRGRWNTFTATAITPDHIEIQMPNDDDAVNDFRYGSLLAVKSGDFNASFDLDGTARLVAYLAQCVGDYLDYETASAGTRAPPAGATPAPSVQPPAQSASNGEEGASHGVSSGTGFIITASGHVLTNNHVIDGCSDIAVRRNGELPQPAGVLFTDQTNDLALLKIDGTFTDSQIANIRVVPGVKAGEDVAVYGFPLAGTLSDTGNIVGGNISALAGLGSDVRLFQISAPIQPGNSGGPLLDKAGNVIGVVNAKLDELKMAASAGLMPQNVNFAIKASIATNFLDAHGIEYRMPSPEPLADLSAVADAAREFTVFIACQ